MISDREEKFNIFAALHKVHDERRLHSRFISVLLQPQGRHGEKLAFLQLFVSQIKELEKFPVNEETLVYPKEFDKKENNNIDILVINRQAKQCLVIENKIYAGDSNLSSGGQLYRYIKHVRDHEKIPVENIFVVYLTLDGHEPSDESIGKFKSFKNVYNHSYEDLIMPWLEQCLKVVVTKPFLRESIVQYKKLIEKMTGNISSLEEKLAYKELIGKSADNMRAAKTLVDNFKHVKWHTMHEFWQSLQQKLIDESDLVLVKPFDKDSFDSWDTNNCIKDITHYEIYRKGQRNKQKCSIDLLTQEGILISVIFSANFENQFYFGIPDKGSNKNEETRKMATQLIKKDDGYHQNNWMLLYKVFKNDLKLNDFSQQATFNLIDDNYRQLMVFETCAEVVELVKRIKLPENELIISSK